MAPPPSSLYTLSFFLAVIATLFVMATLRLLAILPRAPYQSRPLRRNPVATRLLVVLGSGGHTQEMLYLLRDLDTKKYTHRTYVVSSGDAFSAQRVVHFERDVEARVNEVKEQAKKDERNEPTKETTAERPACAGPDHYNVAVVPRARNIHQPLFTAPLTSINCLYRCFAPLLAAPPLLPKQPPQTPYEAAARDLPDMIITNGPATAVIMILASLILRFFNVKSAHSQGKCKTVYVESFARVKSLSLSGKLLCRVVDRFVVQWEELEGSGGGRAEFWGVLV